MIVKISSEKVKEFIERQFAIDGMVSMHDFELWLEEQPKVDDWIPCSKMMPKNQTAVLICLEWDAYDIAWLDGDLWVSELTVYDFETVMAWMPLPEPYESEV